MGIAPLIGGRSGNSLPDYSIVSDGTNVTMLDKAGGTVTAGTDVGALLTNAFTSLSTAGGTIGFRNDGNTFPVKTSALILPSITGKLRIEGNGSTLKMDASSPQFLGVKRTADYQTFQHVRISGFIIDCSAMSNTAGSMAIIGSRVAGAEAQRANYLDWVFEDIYFTGVPVDQTATNSIFGLWLVTSQLATGEGTQTSVKRIRANRVEMDGGNALFVAAGQYPGGLTAGTLNTITDEVYIENWRHDLGIVPASQFSASYVQIGGRGRTGHCYVGKGYGKGSGDIGVEIDCPILGVVENVVSEDSFNSALYFINYCTPANIGENHFVARNCINRKLTSTSATNKLLNATVNSAVNIALGDVDVANCESYQHTVETASTTGWAVNVSDQATAGCASVTLTDCRFVSDSINTGTGVTLVAVSFASRTTTCRVTVRNVRVVQTGAVTGGVTVLTRMVQFGNGVFVIDIDGLRLNTSLTSNVAGSTTGLSLGLSGGATTMNGMIRKLIIEQLLGDTSATGIIIRGTGFLTIPASNSIEIVDCDLTGAAGTHEVDVHTDTAKQTLVLCMGNRWTTKPAPVGLTGLVSATGKALSAAAVFYPCTVQCIQGSGSAVTALDYSTNGGTTYTNLVTQASAALPAGPGPEAGPLLPWDLFRATFTTTQPTVTLVPINP